MNFLSQKKLTPSTSQASAKLCEAMKADEISAMPLGNIASSNAQSDDFLAERRCKWLLRS
ncbi:MAG: hypothetical protein IJP61_10170 [Treponema sp.]|nr:hypothetical protein [Treponema sp.]